MHTILIVIKTYISDDILFYGKYMVIFNLLNLSSLADRRRSHNLVFLNISSYRALATPLHFLPQLTLKFLLSAPATHIGTFFLIPHCPTNYLKNEPINRMMELANEDPSSVPHRITIPTITLLSFYFVLLTISINIILFCQHFTTVVTRAHVRLYLINKY